MKLFPLLSISANLKQVPLILSTSLLLATSLSVRAIAQTTEPEPTSGTSAADLVIPAWGSVEHNTSGGGFDGVTGLNGFIPLGQNPGRNITFLAPRFLLDNDANFGGSLLLGHRFYSASGDRIYGGYLGLDLRETDESSFTQLGLGLESLGERWDFRVNAYIPIGDSRNLIAESRSDTGLVTSTQFQANQLLLSSRQEQQLTQIHEAALLGLDAEAGVRIANWNTGDLRAFGGLYYYDADGTDGTLGWRLRLEARPTQNLTLGLGLQDDDLFGTNLQASVRFLFPRSRPRGPLTDDTAVVARLGEPLGRTPTILVDTQVDTETTVQDTTEPLLNPEEEQPYRFIHVTLGSQGGDGTVERPFGTVQQALNAAVSDGNTIVYVDAGDNSVIPAFTIPDRVRVLSQAPVQPIAGLPFPGFPQSSARLPFSPTTNYQEGILVTLPFSGDERFPIIQDTGTTNLVTMGGRTVFSGFRLQNAVGNAVIANQVEDIEIRDNTITNSGNRGIFLNDVSGSVVLFDNTITTARGGADSGQGILIRNSLDNAVDISIQRQQISGSRVALEIAASGNLSQQTNSEQVVSIDAVTVRDSREQGILLTADQLGNQQVTLRDSTIQGSGAEGIFTRSTNSGSQETTLEDSVVSNNGGDGIHVQSGILNGSTTAAQEFFLRRTRIENNGGNGVLIESNEVAAQEFAADRNTITNNGGDGIRSIASNFSFQEYVTDAQNESSGISNNIINNNQGQGIRLTANNSATLVADIQGNTVNGNNSNPDVEVTATTSNNDVCVVLTSNTTESGIRLNNVSTVPAFFEVGDISSLSQRNIGGVTLNPIPSAFSDRPGITSCF
ncbi:right-handed parallel beta-helix repeat-containing protein [Leptolyngbya sp. FACHB-16]|uniref:right-handed parallel beta-helix repeat-containing protein n=1 Tax=unclassified Leptolyngbya TaxID=2650499 RepID=UPI001684F3D2|nr:right-handed parallel beta-helix repeat-containing protein [Leptolyngbya sp. FACHB-16]MBD2154912.1 right-handed parallel beta-helix repeat-containing protein [Leptolyngbya sp. FACHB-16]